MVPHNGVLVVAVQILETFTISSVSRVDCQVHWPLARNVGIIPMRSSPLAGAGDVDIGIMLRHDLGWHSGLELRERGSRQWLCRYGL